MYLNSTPHNGRCKICYRLYFNCLLLIKPIRFIVFGSVKGYAFESCEHKRNGKTSWQKVGVYYITTNFKSFTGVGFGDTLLESFNKAKTNCLMYNFNNKLC